MQSRLLRFLRKVHRQVVTVQSNAARSEAVVVGMAASLGYITTKLTGRQYGGEWNITIKGLKWLNERDN